MAIFALVIGGSVFVLAILAITHAMKERKNKPLTCALVEIVSGLLVLYGVIGFFGAALSGSGGLNWLPQDIEYPMGWVSGAVYDHDGNVYCPSTPFGRIQVYDKNKNYLRGWSVDANGGAFKINLDPQNQVEVLTARGRMHYVFDKNGTLISSQSYAPKTYSDFDNWDGDFVSIPTPVFLFPMSSPFGSGAIVFVGMLGFGIKCRKRRTPPNKPLKPKSTTQD